MSKLYSIFLVIFCALSSQVLAQNKINITGQIKDALTQEEIIAANVFLKNKQGNILQGVVTDFEGKYNISIEKGNYIFGISYVGYEGITLENILFDKDTIINIALEPTTLETIEVTTVSADKNVQSTQMGVVEIDIETAKKLPALMGEVDIVKTMQLMPGVISSGEGTAGFYVRGGAVDQNLVLLDDAVVYNSGHLLGFFSVFNSDAIKSATLIKGGMPANYGGRLSSVLDVVMKEGTMKEWSAEGGIGLISSRFTAQGPIVKDKLSFIVAARRTYVFDLAQPFIKNTSFAGTNYYFYDLNSKLSWLPTSKDKISLSVYWGRDAMKMSQIDRGMKMNMPWGNFTATGRWIHTFSDKHIMNFTAVYNTYDFSLSGTAVDYQFGVESGIRDYNAKLDFTYYLNDKNMLKYGVDYTHHKFMPNSTKASIEDTNIDVQINPRYGHQAGVYLLHEWTPSRIFSINYGLRFSGFQQLGPFTSLLDSTRYYSATQSLKTYGGIEPRLSAKLSIDEVSSIKMGITVGKQYIHLVSNSSSTLPTDIWVLSGELVKPQFGVQYAAGYFRNFKENMYETSIEVYYKDLRNQLDYAEDFVQGFDTEVEEQFILGKGRAYGIELLARKNSGRLTGWIAYTYGRSFRYFDEILGGKYPARFDKPHDLSIVANYDITKRLNLGLTFVFGSGMVYTPIKSIYLINFSPVMEYGLRNEARLPAYHRMDISLSYELSKEDKPFTSTLVLSVYNLYNRKNVFMTYTIPESDPRSGTLDLKSYKMSLFPILPSIAWNFKWKPISLKRKSVL